MYADDHDDTLPYSYQNSMPGPMRWPAMLAMRGQDYVTLDAIFCPSRVDHAWLTDAVRDVMLTNGRSGFWNYSDYAANRNGAMPFLEEMQTLGLRSLRLSDPLPASNLLLLGEGWNLTYFASERYGWCWLTPGFSQERLFMHNETQTNVGFLDGHVETMQDEDLGYSASSVSWKYPLASQNYTEAPWYYREFTSR